MEITNAYRQTRRNTSILCCIGLAWSAAQFEFKSLSFGPIDSIDLSYASVPLMLACGILYTLTRCTIEFAMQSDDVRRWHLAQIDFKITVFLVRATLLILAAGGLHRSIETVVYVVIATLLLLVGSAFLMFIGMLLLTPLRMTIRDRKGLSISAASSVAEAEGWSILIVVSLLVVVIVAAGVASLRYEPMRSLWTVVPSLLAVAIVVVTAIAVVISIYVERIWSRKLFAFQDNRIMTKLPNGTIGVKFKSEKNEKT